MIPVIGETLPVAVGIALSPFPIVAVILMLFTKKARSNSMAFGVGWMLGLGVVGFIVLALVNAGRVTLGESTESMLSGIVKVLLALLLFRGAKNQWKNRPQEGEEPEMPKWMETIDDFTIGKSLSMAFLLSGINPKNLALNLSAAVTIANAELGSGEQALTMVIFVLIASLSIAVPVFYYLIAGANAEKMLNTWKAWLIANDTTVMAALFVVFGFKLLGDGLAILFG